MFSLIGLNMFKRFKHDSSEGSLGLSHWRLNIGAFKQFKHNPLPDPGLPLEVYFLPRAT